MKKKNLKTKILFFSLVLLVAVFLLFSCNKVVLPDDIVINGYPDKIVSSTSNFVFDGLEVVAFYNSGSVEKLKQDAYSEPKEVSALRDTTTYPGIEIRYYRVYLIAKPELDAYFPMIINPFYTEGLIDLSARAIGIESKVVGSFTYLKGSEFDPSSVAIKIHYEDGSTNFDRGEHTIRTEIRYGSNNEVDTQSDELRKIILRGGIYDVSFIALDYVGILNISKTTIKVLVAGGDDPLHLKYGTSAQWFDYVLVLWIAYIMNYTSFGIFALGIVFTTIIVRTIAWPIYANSNNMTFKMAMAQPDLQKLEEKYRGRTDTMAQQQKQQETMKIYKKHGVKFTGCIFMILQMPLFMAMWQVVRRILVPGGMFVDTIRDSRAFGIDNFFTSGAGQWNFSHLFVVIIMAITYIALMLIGQKKPAYTKKTQQHHKPVAPQQNTKSNPLGAGMGKMMIWVMTVVMIVMAFSNNNALTFYWIIGNLYSLGQTILMKYLNSRKYRLQQLKETLGSLYDDKAQRLISYKQMVIEEVKNDYYDTKDKIANPYNKSKIKTFLNKVFAVIWLIPINFIKKLELNIREKRLISLKNKYQVVGGR